MFRTEERNGVIDLGFGWIKAMVGPKLWKGQAVLGEKTRMHEEDLRSDDLIYEAPNWEGFVGDLAIRHSLVRFASTKEDKANNWTSKVFLRTAFGYLAPDSVINVVTGLPVDFFFNQKADFEALLQSFNEETDLFPANEFVRYPHYLVKTGRRTITANPKINNYKIVAQPYGTAMYHLLREDGSKNDVQGGTWDDAKKRILVIDVGYYTLDLLVLDKLEIGPKSCSPDKMGVDTAYQLIQEYLKERFGKAPNRYELDAAILGDKEYNGLNIVPLVDRAFKAFGNMINQQVGSLNETFGKYLVCGGWAAAIAPYLDLPEEKTRIYGQTSNVEGYRRIAARQWPDSHA
jgi:hypothetical protein